MFAGLACTYNAIPQKKGPKGSRAKVLAEIREHQRINLGVSFPHDYDTSASNLLPGIVEVVCIRRMYASGASIFVQDVVVRTVLNKWEILPWVHFLTLVGRSDLDNGIRQLVCPLTYEELHRMQKEGYWQEDPVWGGR